MRKGAPAEAAEPGEPEDSRPDAARADAPTSTQPTFNEIVRRLDSLWGFDQFALEGAERAAPAAPHRFGKYLVYEVVGSGSFGVVYRAHDEQLRRDVALKLPRPGVLGDRERLARFCTEAVAAASLHHPGIVPVFEADLTGPVPFIASELVLGSDLGCWLEGRTAPIGGADAAALVARLAAAVHYAHQRKVLHRDLKPGNVLLATPSGASPIDDLAEVQPRLTDFGLAKLVEASLQDTRSSLLVGTPAYMAPEQLSRTAAEPSAATDVYALGVILYELLTLRLPFEGSAYVEVLDKVRSTEPVGPRQLNPQTPRDLDTICRKCLAKDPTDRYASAAALEDDLARFLAGGAISAKPTTRLDRLMRWCRQPERLATAGWFTCWFEALLGLWMWTYWFTAFGIGALEGFVAQSFQDSLAVTIAFTLPMALLGWALWRWRSTRAFWPAATLSVIQFGIAVHAATHKGAVFDYLYPTVFSKIASYTMLIMGAAMQLGIYVLAVPAWRQARTRPRGRGPSEATTSGGLAG